MRACLPNGTAGILFPTLWQGGCHGPGENVRAAAERNRVADELGVSVRTLARAFAMHGTSFDRGLE